MPFDGIATPSSALVAVANAARHLDIHNDLGAELAPARGAIAGACDLLDGPFSGMSTAHDFANARGALAAVLTAISETEELASAYPGNDFAPALEALHDALERLCGAMKGVHQVSGALARMAAA